MFSIVQPRFVSTFICFSELFRLPHHEQKGLNEPSFCCGLCCQPQPQHRSFLPAAARLTENWRQTPSLDRKPSVPQVTSIPLSLSPYPFLPSLTQSSRLTAPRTRLSLQTCRYYQLVIWISILSEPCNPAYRVCNILVIIHPARVDYTHFSVRTITQIHLDTSVIFTGGLFSHNNVIDQHV